MTDDKLEAMAREAHADTGKDYNCHRLWLARFAELVRADERERCALACESVPLPPGPILKARAAREQLRCAAAIRALPQA